MKTKEKVKSWVSDHKKEIYTGIKVAIGIGVAAVIGKKVVDGFKTMSYTPRTKTITYSPKIGVPNKVRELPSELIERGFEVYSDGDKFIEFANYGLDIPDLTIADMHDVIDKITEIPGFNENSGIQAMFNVYGLD